jgi:hypothetical protein
MHVTYHCTVTQLATDLSACDRGEARKCWQEAAVSAGQTEYKEKRMCSRVHACGGAVYVRLKPERLLRQRWAGCRCRCCCLCRLQLTPMQSQHAAAAHHLQQSYDPAAWLSEGLIQQRSSRKVEWCTVDGTCVHIKYDVVLFGWCGSDCESQGCVAGRPLPCTSQRICKCLLHRGREEP